MAAIPLLGAIPGWVWGAGAFALLLLWAIAIYNGLVGLKNAAKEAWAQIDVQLQRRHDLIPNLVETAKGYMKHERETLERVIQARNQAIAAMPQGPAAVAQAENALMGAVRQLFALAENYPDLKANQNMLALQEELTSTENRVSFARQHYNDSVRRYNTRLEQVPANIVKGFGDFPPMEFYEVEEAAAREVPKVAF
jgi:LemA protein